jgi:hypothetical protein
VLSHLLIHSYLAAFRVSKRPDDWGKSEFEALTLDGASFEGLGMLLEQVDDDQVDELVRRVDGWNFYAAAFLLAEDLQSGSRTSPELRTALLLLLGRRRFSGVPSTEIQVEDALRIHGGDLPQAILAADSIGALVDLALEIQIEGDWWRTWSALFSAQPGDTVPKLAIDALGGEDGVLAWTAANVLATLVLDESTAAALRDIALTAVDDSVRWRAVHALGGTPDPSSIAVFLTLLLQDRSPWVRNGALRSFMLVTSLLPTPQARVDAFQRLADQSHVLLSEPKWLREVERSARLTNAPAKWPEAVGVLLESLWIQADSVEEQDRWRSLSASLRTEWEQRDKLGSL